MLGMNWFPVANRQIEYVHSPSSVPLAESIRLGIWLGSLCSEIVVSIISLRNLTRMVNIGHTQLHTIPV